MTEALFYHLDGQPLERVLPVLLQVAHVPVQAQRRHAVGLHQQHPEQRGRQVALPEPLGGVQFEMPPPPPPAPAPVVTNDAAQVVEVVAQARRYRLSGLGKRRAARDARPAAAEPPRQEPAGAKDMSRSGMPTPVVHASALSVVVPAVGEAVRYQRLLLPSGAAYSVEIAAKEPLFAKE